MDPEILAQAQAAAPNVGEFEQWWHYGPLGAFAFIAAVTVAGCISFGAYFAYVIWAPDYRKRREQDAEYQQEKRRLDLLKEQKQNDLYDTLRECQIQDQDHKRVVTTAIAKIADSQHLHAADCAGTRHMVAKIARHLEVE